MLKDQANEAISTYPYSEVPDHWRRLYMDATLIHVVSRLMEYSTPQEEDLLELVRLLDMANIVTAYFDDGRRQVLFNLLSLVQSLFTAQDDDEQPSAKKQRRHGKSPLSEYDRSAFLLPGIETIKTYTLENAPDMTELTNETPPFIIKGAIADWPAISDLRHAWRDSKYLLKIAGRGRIVPVEIGSSYTAEGWTQKMTLFDEFLEKIRWNSDDEQVNTEGDRASQGEQPVLYLAQHDLFQQFPQLLNDIIIPDYIYSAPDPPPSFPEYKPPTSPDGYTINAWMGPKTTYSPAHTDLFYNCYGKSTSSYPFQSERLQHVDHVRGHAAQVVGRKHIWIAPPSCTPAMEGRPLDNRDHSSDEDNEDHRNAAAQQFMDNTAQIDVFEASQPFPGQTKLPLHIRRFREEVLPHARQAILEEGDLLFMPPK